MNDQLLAVEGYGERPLLLDVYSGSGGAARGYYDAGFRVIGVDLDPKPLRHYPFPSLQADALETLARLTAGERLEFSDGHSYGLEDFAAIHASPPCQGYSIMHNLPWLRGRDYPLLILPTIEILEAIGKPYVVENVMGARHGAKGLKKRRLEAHGLKAGWLCGWMFNLPFQRHRLFASNWFWLAPGHPKHKGRSRVVLPTKSGNFNPFYKDGKSIIGPGNLGKGAGLGTYDRHQVPANQNIHQSFSVRAASPARLGGTLPHSYADGNRVMRLNDWAESSGQPMGHNGSKGWQLAAEAMGISWMTRAELTQAIPPAYTFFVGQQLLRHLEAQS